MTDIEVGALITAVGVILAALIERVDWHVRRTSRKIDGLRNGTYTQAMKVIEELRRERAEREIRGLRPRRAVDRIVEEHPAGPQGG